MIACRRSQIVRTSRVDSAAIAAALVAPGDVLQEAAEAAIPC